MKKFFEAVNTAIQKVVNTMFNDEALKYYSAGFPNYFGCGHSVAL